MFNTLSIFLNLTLPPQRLKLLSTHMDSSTGVVSFLFMEWFEAIGRLNHSKVYIFRLGFLVFFFLPQLLEFVNVSFVKWLCFTGKRRKFNKLVIYASLFGVGAPEALVIGVVALLVFGPKGLAEVIVTSSAIYLTVCCLVIICNDKWCFEILKWC